MITTITLEPARTIDIDVETLKLTKVIDNQVDTITASVDGLWRDIILWKGASEYASSGAWTNDTALAQAKALFSSNKVVFA